MVLFVSEKYYMGTINEGVSAMNLFNNNSSITVQLSITVFVRFYLLFYYFLLISLI